MSYEIVYAREFVKTKNGDIIPLVLIGSNNCYSMSFITGRERRERHWDTLLVRESECPAISADKLMERVNSYIPGEYQEHFVRNGKWVNDDGYVRFFKNGIKKAKTLEEINTELITDTRLRGCVYYNDKNDGFTPLYESLIHYSDELEYFLEKHSDIVAENNGLYKIFVNLEFVGEDALKRPKKTKPKKARMTEKFYVISKGKEYISQVMGGKIWLSSNLNGAKQFASEKEAKQWLKDKNLERRFKNSHFEIEYVA